MSTTKSAKKIDETNLRNDDLLCEVTLDEALREAGLDVGGTAKERADRLELHYLALPKPAGWSEKPYGKGGQGPWLLVCEIGKSGCGYTSTGKQTFCVFCGDGKDEAEKKSTELAVRPKDADAIEGEFMDDEGGEGLPSPDAEPSGTAEDLDKAVEAIKARQRALEEGERSVTGNEWDLGVAIFDVFKKNLFVARKKDGGAPLYSSWQQFCKAELGMSSATANRYMRIATNFTRELAQDLGPSKLVELLPAAEAQAADQAIAARLGREPKLLLPPLIERARVLDVRDLRSEVKAAMPASKPPTGKTGNATAAAAAKKNAAKPPEKERLTVQRQEGTAKIRFFLNEKAARENDKTKAAKKFADGIVAVEPAVNGVEVVCTLKMDAQKGPVLVRKIVRVS